MLISVVVPTWQRADLLRNRCLPSLACSKAETDLIVVADGHDPAARLIAAEFRARYLEIDRPDYPRDELQRWHAVGIRAVNAGLDAATGDWVIVVNDDDELVPGGLDALVERAAGSNADVIHGGSSVLQRDGSWVDVNEGPPWFRWFPIGSALIRRATLGRTRLDPDAYRSGIPADREFWRRLYREGMTFERIPELVYRYWPGMAYQMAS